MAGRVPGGQGVRPAFGVCAPRSGSAGARNLGLAQACAQVWKNLTVVLKAAQWGDWEPHWPPDWPWRTEEGLAQRGLQHSRAGTGHRRWSQTPRWTDWDAGELGGCSCRGQEPGWAGSFWEEETHCRVLSSWGGEGRLVALCTLRGTCHVGTIHL